MVDLLRSSGGMTGVALGKADERLRTQLSYAVGKSYGGPAAINSRVLNILSAQGRIVRGRPGGSWTGSRYVWAPIESWLPAGPPNRPRTPPAGRPRPAVAGEVRPRHPCRHRLVDGVESGDTRRALAALDTAEVDMDGEPDSCWPLTSRTSSRWRRGSRCCLRWIPPRWAGIGRDWYLPAAHRAVLFDRTGNIGPSIWCDGRIVGGWAQRADATDRLAAAGRHRRRPDRRGRRWRRPGSPTGWRGCG